jgi:4-hydroxybenzoate polyprenyltransferase
MMLAIDYARERVICGPVLAAVLLVTAGAQVGRGSTGAAIAVTDLALSLCFVVSFRIWDDVMDRERDRLRHPERVAVRARSTTSLSLAAWCVAVGGAGGLMRVHGVASAMLVIVFAAVLATWYAFRGRRSAAGDRILLVKYAAFTLALIGPAPVTPRAAASALGVYLAACIYEWRHDRESPVFSFGGSR